MGGLRYAVYDGVLTVGGFVPMMMMSIIVVMFSKGLLATHCTVLFSGEEVFSVRLDPSANSEEPSIHLRIGL